MTANPTGPIGPHVLTINGTSQFLFNSWPPQFWEVAAGDVNSPITTVGPLVKFSRTESMNKTNAKGNAADSEANATFAVYSYSLSTSNMQGNAFFGAAIGEPIGTDLVGIIGHGRVINAGTGIGTGGFFEGRRDNTTGKALGVELRCANISSVSLTYNANGFASGGAWITAQSTDPSVLAGSGIMLGSVAGARFDVGFGVTANSVATTTFRDDSNAITSIMISGTHTTGIDLSGATLTNVIKLPAASKPTVSGSRGSNAALASLLTALATLGLITDSTS